MWVYTVGGGVGGGGMEWVVVGVGEGGRIQPIKVEYMADVCGGDGGDYLAGS